MQVLIPGKSYPKRRDLLNPSETLVVTVLGSDGATLQTPTVTPVTGDEETEVAAIAGDQYLDLVTGSNPSPGWYLPVSDWGDAPIEIISWDADALRAYLRDPLLIHLPAGTVLEPVTVDYTLTVPSDYTGDIVYVTYTSAERSQRETFLVNAHELVNPFDLFREIPRLRGQDVNRPDLLQVPTLALEDLRGRLFATDRIVMDNCQIPGRLLPWMRCWVQSYLTEQGIDIIGADVDRLDALSRFNQNLAVEFKALVASKIWSDASDVATATQSGRGWKVVI
jgi:hypothetical protein